MDTREVLRYENDKVSEVSKEDSILQISIWLLPKWRFDDQYEAQYGYYHVNQHIETKYDIELALVYDIWE